MLVQDRELAQAEIDGESHYNITVDAVSIWAPKSSFVFSVVKYYRIESEP